MIDVTLFDELKKYLTKEFMDLSRQKDEMLCEKVSLEVEKQQEDYPLFQNKDALRIKRLFSPLDDDIFEEELDSFQNDKILQKLQNIENNLQIMEDSMGDIKKYLCFVQMLENDLTKQNEPEVAEQPDTEEESLVIENDAKLEEIPESSPNIRKMLEEAAEFLQAQYPNTEILLDFEDNDQPTKESLNDYFIRILTYTISASIEGANVDTVIIEGNVSEEKLFISLQMLLEDEIVDQCSYQYEIILKNK